MRRCGCCRRGSCSRWSRSLAALAAATVSGAIRLDRLPNPFLTQLSFAGDGVSIDYPDNWVQLTPEDPGGLSSAFTSLIVANRAVPGCSPAELEWGAGRWKRRALVCDTESGSRAHAGTGRVGSHHASRSRSPTGRHTAASRTRCSRVSSTRRWRPVRSAMALSFGPPQEIGVGPIETFDAEAWYGRRIVARRYGVPAGANAEGKGWTEEIDGMPAKLVVSAGSESRGRRRSAYLGHLRPPAVRLGLVRPHEPPWPGHRGTPSAGRRDREVIALRRAATGARCVAP